jgi:hypothetical protein
MEHVGPSDNDDAGFCLCEVHGGIEVGGGLLHGGISLPVAPGAVSVQGRRRLWLGGDDWTPVARRVYQAEGDLSHGPGRADGDAWAASPGEDDAGHMVYGPYAVDWGDGGVTVVFDLAAAEVAAADRTLAILDIHDATAGEVLARSDVRGGDLPRAGVWEAIALEANLVGRAGHALEARVDFRDVVGLRVDQVTVLGAQ